MMIFMEMFYTQTQVSEYESGLTQSHTSGPIEGDRKKDCLSLLARIKTRGNTSDVTVIENGIAFTESTVIGPCRVTITYATTYPAHEDVEGALRILQSRLTGIGTNKMAGRS
jgi:hypothetical protein